MDKYFKIILSFIDYLTKISKKRTKKTMNQVRVTSPTSLTSIQVNIDLLTFICDSCLMSFAHQSPHDVRFMFRFAQHGSHHMASISIYVGISVHYIYHMFVSFLTPSEAPRLVRSRGVHC